MNRSLKTSIVASLMAGVIGPSVQAGWDQSPLGRSKFGPLWSGALKPSDLEGKVVLVKHWADW